MRTQESRMRLPALLLVILLVGGMIMPATVAADTETPKLPSHLRLVEDATAQSWTQRPGSQTTGPVQVVVHVDKAPLAMVGKY